MPSTGARVSVDDLVAGPDQASRSRVAAGGSIPSIRRWSESLKVAMTCENSCPEPHGRDRGGRSRSSRAASRRARISPIRPSGSIGGPRTSRRPSSRASPSRARGAVMTSVVTMRRIREHQHPRNPDVGDGGDLAAQRPPPRHRHVGGDSPAATRRAARCRPASGRGFAARAGRCAPPRDRRGISRVRMGSAGPGAPGSATSGRPEQKQVLLHGRRAALPSGASG